jgi:hypothetical protein
MTLYKKSITITILAIAAAAISVPLVIPIERKPPTTSTPIDETPTTTNTTTPTAHPTLSPTQTLIGANQLISAIISERTNTNIDYPVVQFKCEGLFCGRPKLLVPTIGLCTVTCTTQQLAADRTTVPGHTTDFTRCTQNSVMTEFDCSGFSCDNLTFRCCNINNDCTISETYDTQEGQSGGLSECQENQVMVGARWKSGAGLLDILCSDVSVS